MVKLGAELAAYLIKEVLYPNKITSQHLSSKGGRLSWANATQKEHEAIKRKEATNGNTEIPFGSLTSQLEIFSTIRINHFSDILLTRYNKDFY